MCPISIEFFKNIWLSSKNRSKSIKNGKKWSKIWLILTFLIEYHFQSLNQHSLSFNQHFYCSFNLLIKFWDVRNKSKIDQKWSKKIENWLIFIRFLTSSFNPNLILVVRYESDWNQRSNLDSFILELSMILFVGPNP